MNRRRLFKLIAGAIVAPKELLAAPVETVTMYQFGFSTWKIMRESEWLRSLPASEKDCFYGDIKMRSPRMNFVITGIKFKEPTNEPS